VQQALLTQISLVIKLVIITTSAYNSNFFGYQAGIAQQMYSGQIYWNQYWGWERRMLIIQISWVCW
jgi:hypothetical protein